MKKYIQITALIIFLLFNITVKAEMVVYNDQIFPSLFKAQDQNNPDGVWVSSIKGIKFYIHLTDQGFQIRNEYQTEYSYVTKVKPNIYRRINYNNYGQQIGYTIYHVIDNDHIDIYVDSVEERECFFTRENSSYSSSGSYSNTQYIDQRINQLKRKIRDAENQLRYYESMNSTGATHAGLIATQRNLISSYNSQLQALYRQR